MLTNADKVALSCAGMHSSISAHIAKEYLLDERAGRWGPNLALFQERLGNEGVRERVENLYFAYLFVLRAALKAGPLLKEAAYDTGSPLEDAQTSELVRRLVSALCTPVCPVMTWMPNVLSADLLLQGLP